MRVAVVLSGCGYMDGAEVRESVLSLLYLDQSGAVVDCYAPDISQADVVNHADGEVSQGSRNVLEESARIARGDVRPLSSLDADDYDALVIPGGYGAAKSLSDFASRGSDCVVIADMKNTIHAFFEQKKPIAAICIAPAIVAASLKGKGITLTIGEDASVAAAIEALGHSHVVTPSDMACVDEYNRVVSCSAYMRDDSLSRIAQGIEHTVKNLVTLINQQPLSKAS